MADTETNPSQPRFLERSPDARHTLGEIATSGRYDHDRLQRIVSDLGRTYSPDKQRMSDTIVGSVNHLLGLLASHGIDLEKLRIKAMPIGLIPEALVDLPIEEIELSTRPYNVLHKNEIRTLGQLGNLSELELEAMIGMGKKSIAEIEDELAMQGWLAPELLEPTPLDQRPA
ncbi:TPA: hypothetical protein DIS56_02200 [Candidatus Saccharibacteria bacterium]|nr:MAG: DNA-directed RNA polymerase subunit alpha [Candidatus Saccharibacteria bacterium GW2011_GWA2_46_10]OGL36271.1 MAG: hypothetical protein A3F05_03090 [Candidatus Saccharibacteria bacterium RIFCSPHIGHO2_12_FULL_47_17]HCM51923.1 hypothetical protein [Candidatus Saccharibacteria bacterium]